MLYDGFYGSEAGGWVYPRASEEISLWAFVLGGLLAIGVVIFAWLSRRIVEQYTTPVIVFWLIVGFFVQVAIWSLSDNDFETVVQSGTNGFYEVAARHSVAEFLGDFQTLSRNMSFHVRANLAGKVVFFHLLRCVTESPRETGWLILCISNLGGVLAFAITRDLYGTRSAGLAALLLYLFLPAKLFFIPLMNTVTPVFILLPLWMLLRFCATRRPLWLVAVGCSLYWLVLFDPLALVTGLVFLAVLARAIGRGDIGWWDVGKVAALVPLAFWGADWLVARASGYEIIEAARFAMDHAKEFNELNKRPYGLWVVQNPIDFLVNTGIATSVLFLGLAASAGLRVCALWCRNGWRAASELAARTEVSIVLSVLAVLVILDWMGINRGESIRLWIFLGAFIVIPVAAYCGRRPVVFSIVIALALVQACATLSTREFVSHW